MRVPEGPPARAADPAATPPGTPAAAPSPAARRRPVRRLLLLVAAAIVLTYVLVCLGLFFAQPYLIYFPSPRYVQTPADVGLAYEEIVLQAADGTPVIAWFVANAASEHVALFCHGNGENLGDLAQTTKTLHRLGFATLAFDYRGYGRSGGVPTEAGLYRDAEAAWSWLTATRGVAADRIVIIGRSLGGAVAIELARRHTPGALVAECTFTSLVEIGQQEYPLLPIGLLCTHRYESARKVPAIPCPKLFLHGTDDELIPLAIGRRLFDAACPPKTLIETPGGHTSAGFEHSWEITQQVGEWLDQALSRPTARTPRPE